MAKEWSAKYHGLEEAREAFIRNQSREGRGKLSFEELLKCFKRIGTRVSVLEMGWRHGVRRQRITQLYDMYFRHLFCGRSLEELRVYRSTRKKAFLARRKVRSKKRYRLLMKCEARAKSKGCVTSRRIKVNGALETRRIMIGGSLCSIQSPSTGPSPRSTEREYIAASIARSTVKEVAYCIFVVTTADQQERFFIVPAAKLYDKYFATFERDEAHLHILRRPDSAIQRHFQELDAWDFEDVWPERT